MQNIACVCMLNTFLGSHTILYTLCKMLGKLIYLQTPNISCTLVGNEIVDHSDVVGASPVDAAPTTSSFST